MEYRQSCLAARSVWDAEGLAVSGNMIAPLWLLGANIIRWSGEHQITVYGDLRHVFLSRVMYGFRSVTGGFRPQKRWETAFTPGGFGKTASWKREGQGKAGRTVPDMERSG